MNYLSTRGATPPLSFRETVLTGLARDGGLFMPETFPCATASLEAWSKLSYPDLAFEIMRLYADDIPADDLRLMIRKSYNTFRSPEVTPSVQLGDLQILELWHGPTLAFKDVALQFLGNLFEYLLAQNKSRLAIVAATSGDTGSAAIDGVRGREGIDIFVMHPKGRVSPMQELQMTTVPDANVHNFAVEGSFDDCQNMVKALFNDHPFRDAHHLGAVNSINWARILAQIVYYFYAAFRAREATGKNRFAFAVPTGNFGDVFAGYAAWRMGLPVERLIIATNENDILTRFFATGVYAPGAAAPTTSPSMDIQVASNFERYLYCRAENNGKTVAAWMKTFATEGRLVPDVPEGKPVEDPVLTAIRVDSQTVAETIRRFACDHCYTLDPHTAIGVRAAQTLYPQPDDRTAVICLATAHPAKFPQTVADATGGAAPTHPILEALRNLPPRVATLPADAEALKAAVGAALAAKDAP